MKLDVKLQTAGCADGVYSVDARGYASAMLYWADAQGPLENWTALGCAALDDSGQGVFREAGHRAIPPCATHVAACFTAEDPERSETLLAPIEPAPQTEQGGHTLRIGVMSDLHLSAKPYRIRSAMRLLKDCDCILLAGDLTNDGLPEQFDLFWRCIEEELALVPVLAVTGNHDYPVRPLPLIRTGMDDYYQFQQRLLERAAALGVDCREDESGAFEAAIRGCRIFGLNAVSHFRRFVFPDGRQLDWLADRLRACSGPHRIVFCHAPLRRHNSNDRTGRHAPYLSRDNQLQSIIDDAGSLCFISGHTHVSVNVTDSCAELDAQTGVLYLNDSSVTKTDLKQKGAMHPEREWTDGAVLLLTYRNGELEIDARAVYSGKHIARGYHRIPCGTQA